MGKLKDLIQGYRLRKAQDNAYDKGMQESIEQAYTYDQHRDCMSEYITPVHEAMNNYLDGDRVKGFEERRFYRLGIRIAKRVSNIKKRFADRKLKEQKKEYLKKIDNEYKQRLIHNARKKKQTVDLQITPLDETNLDSTLKQNRAVFIEFYGPSCPACKQLQPVYSRVATKYADRALFGKFDLTRAMHLATRYSLKSVPTIIAFTDGKERARSVGYHKFSELEQFVQNTIYS